MSFLRPLTQRRAAYDPLSQHDVSDTDLLSRIHSSGSSTDSSFELSDIEVASKAFDNVARARSTSGSSISSLLNAISPSSRTFSRRRSRKRRLLFKITQITLALLIAWIAVTPLLNPSYVQRPAHYSGTNVHGEKVFIAANIVDEELIRGEWGNRIVQLVELLGTENVFLSIYENDSGEGTKSALRELGERVACEKSIVSGHIDLPSFPSIQILPSDHRIKRIDYLAHVRNQAIAPLHDLTTSSSTHFDKLLFINDVIFDPKDAADLLFATNVGQDGKARYHAACAMDFINAFKFYDTFASRDAEGWALGVPFFPWFTGAGDGISRRDVLEQRDAVRVKSCWGGMVAFEAKWFMAQDEIPIPTPQTSKKDDSKDMHASVTPALTSKNQVQFRASPELMWDASECCLIHADIAALASTSPEEWEDHENYDTGIYMNPFVRVAYDANSHGWLEFTRRFERLYSGPQRLVNWLVSRPPFGPRRTAEAGEKYEHREWVFDGPLEDDGMAEGFGVRANRSTLTSKELTAEIYKYGHWESVERIAMPGGFCGGRQLLTLRPTPWIKGEKIWEKISPPPGAGDRG